MTDQDLGAILDTWEKSLATFSEILDLAETSIVRDAAIKRFEYNFELAWKTIRHFALAEGSDCNSPKGAFKEAFKLGWIKDSEIWLDMLDDRNLTTHTYSESTVSLVYANLRGYLSAFQTLHDALRKALNA